jgi:hypothetical protein
VALTVSVMAAHIGINLCDRNLCVYHKNVDISSGFEVMGNSHRKSASWQGGDLIEFCLVLP